MQLALVKRLQLVKMHSVNFELQNSSERGSHEGNETTKIFLDTFYSVCVNVL